MKVSKLVVSVILFQFIFVVLSYARVENMSNVEQLELMRVAKKNTVIVSVSGNGYEGHGSGFVIKKLGAKTIIATNAHVIDMHGKIASSISVIPNGSDKRINASVLAYFYNSNQFIDLAFLVVTDINGILGQEVPLAREINIGDFVLAVGSPLNDNFITATGKIIKKQAVGNNTLVVHDALIERGNSGGGLFNSRGELIGINTYLTKDQYGIAVSNKIIEAMKIYSFELNAKKLMTQVSKEKNMWLDTGINIGIGDQVAILGEGTWDVNLGNLMGTKMQLCSSGTPLKKEFVNDYNVYPDLYYASVLAKVGKQDMVRAMTYWWENQMKDKSMVQFINKDSSGQLYFGLNILDYTNFPQSGYNKALGFKPVMDLTIAIFDSKLCKAAPIGSNTNDGEVKVIEKSNSDVAHYKSVKIDNKIFIVELFEDASKLRITAKDIDGEKEAQVLIDANEPSIEQSNLKVSQNAANSKMYDINMNIPTGGMGGFTHYITCTYVLGKFTVIKDTVDK